MGMKPPMNEKPVAIPGVVNNANDHPSGEDGNIDPNTVSSSKKVGNTKLDSNLVSGPHGS
jgi:hypothetical protein